MFQDEPREAREGRISRAAIWFMGFAVYGAIAVGILRALKAF